jgi:predicted RNA-binding protein (virulence factor B family)
MQGFSNGIDETVYLLFRYNEGRRQLHRVSTPANIESFFKALKTQFKRAP